MNINEIKKHLYNDSLESAKKYITSVKDEETLYVYTNNYNWDNGFDIPISIINNPSCSLSVALLIFHLADGITYLNTKSTNDNLPEWSAFIETLYNKIISNTYKPGTVSFTPELNKVQLMKLRKSLSSTDQIFITEIIGSDCNILL